MLVLEDTMRASIAIFNVGRINHGVEQASWPRARRMLQRFGRLPYFGLA